MMKKIGEIKNKKSLSGDHWKTQNIEFFERHYIKNGKSIVEYYYDYILESYFETEYTSSSVITRGFSKKNILFSTNVIYLSANGKPFMCYNEVLTKDNIIKHHYRKINANNQYSLVAFKSFSECLAYKPEIT